MSAPDCGVVVLSLMVGLVALRETSPKCGRKVPSGASGFGGIPLPVRAEDDAFRERRQGKLAARIGLKGGNVPGVQPRTSLNATSRHFSSSDFAAAWMTAVTSRIS